MSGSLSGGHVNRLTGKRSVNPVWTWERANRTQALSTASTGRCPLRREGARTGSARCSTVLARLPQRRLPAGPNAYPPPAHGSPAHRSPGLTVRVSASSVSPASPPARLPCRPSPMMKVDLTVEQDKACDDGEFSRRARSMSLHGSHESAEPGDGVRRGILAEGVRNHLKEHLPRGRRRQAH